MNTKKKFTKSEFKETISKLNLGKRTLEIGYGVLVLGNLQKEYADKFNISTAAVSLSIKRIVDAYYDQQRPSGYETITAVLPSHQAFLVQKWAKIAKKEIQKKIDKKNSVEFDL